MEAAGKADAKTMKFAYMKVMVNNEPEEMDRQRPSERMSGNIECAPEQKGTLEGGRGGKEEESSSPVQEVSTEPMVVLGCLDTVRLGGPLEMDPFLLTGSF